MAISQAKEKERMGPSQGSVTLSTKTSALRWDLLMNLQYEP